MSPSRAASPVDYSSTQADAAAPRPTTDTAYTWWSNRGQAYAKNVGWRLDYHLVTPAMPHWHTLNTFTKTNAFQTMRR